jgi:hypothetical protein
MTEQPVTIKLTLKDWTTTYVLDYNDLMLGELDAEHGALLRQLALGIEEDLQRKMCEAMLGRAIDKDEWPTWNSASGQRVGGVVSTEGGT